MLKLKKLVLMLLMICSLMMLSGCIRFSTTIKVKSNGKADITMLMATVKTDETLDDDTEDDEEDIDQLVKEGWKYEKYDEDNYEGFLLTKKDVPLEDLGKTMNSEESLDMNTDGLSVTKKGSKYSISWDISGSEDYEEAEDYSSYLESAGGYGKFILELPNKPISSNAHEVSKDGKTLTWNIFSMKSGEKIEVEFSLINWPLIIGIIIAIILIIVAVIVIFIIRKKKSANSSYPQNNQQYNNLNQGQQYYDPNQGQQYYDPNQGQQYYDPNQGQQYYDPNQGQQYYDPNQGQQYYDPNQGQQYYDPSQGQQYYDPNQGQQYYDTNQGQQYYDPSQGQQNYDPNQGQQYYDPNQGQQYYDPSQNQ